MSERIEFSNLAIDLTIDGDTVTYAFNGDVDENFKQEDVPRIKRDRIVFVLKDINNFNSCGIREWIYLIKDLSQLGQLVFKQCSVTMIDQINMVPESLATGEIESFFAPYFCETHGEQIKSIEIFRHRDAIANKIAPPFKCETCGKDLEFDALEESYFLFAEGTVQAAS